MKIYYKGFESKNHIYLVECSNEYYYFEQISHDKTNIKKAPPKDIINLIKVSNKNDIFYNYVRKHMIKFKRKEIIKDLLN